MNLARYRITINPAGIANKGAQRAYVSKVTEHLRWMHRTTMGKLLLESIRFHKKPVVIRPYLGGNCNAFGGSETVAGADRGFVEYSPDTFSLHGACPANGGGPNNGLLWDEVLFHELFHVFRRLSGKHNKIPLSFGLHQYTNNEEFYAVLITNIYISDPTNKIKSGLRANHKSFDRLSTDFDDPFEFFSSSALTFDLIEKFTTDNRGISIRIAHDLAKAPFNPIADFFMDKEKARELSRNAQPRDLVGLIQHLRRIFSP